VVGFVPSNTIIGESGSGSKLVVAATFEVEFSTSFERVALMASDFLGRNNATRLQAWVIQCAREWDQARWREERAPLRSTIETMFHESGSSRSGPA
jgi:hypothetical protein